MFQIASNRKIGNDIYLMEVERKDGGAVEGEPGQFYMVRVPDSFMVLGRPISIMDIRDKKIFFMYKIIGKGTKLLSKQMSGAEIGLHGPYGRGYPVTDCESKKTALIGGGLGIAPLLYTARKLKDCTLYLGLNSSDVDEQDQRNLEEMFAAYGNYHLYFDTDMTEKIRFEDYEAVMTCGPEVMMRKITQKHDNVYLSMEKHMACGVGACMSCTCEGSKGRVKVCKDGPVFHQSEVISHA